MEYRSIFSGILKTFEYIMNLAFINLIWLIFTFPIFTWFTSTVAMQYSIHRWIIHDDQRVFLNFIDAFKRHFKRTWWMGVVSSSFALIWVCNFFFIVMHTHILAILLITVLILFGIIYLFVHFTIFSMIVIYPDLKAKDWIKNSVLLSFSNPFAIITCSVMLMMLIGVFWMLPTLIPMYGWSVFAMVCHSTVHSFLVKHRIG